MKLLSASYTFPKGTVRWNPAGSAAPVNDNKESVNYGKKYTWEVRIFSSSLDIDIAWYTMLTPRKSNAIRLLKSEIDFKKAKEKVGR